VTTVQLLLFLYYLKRSLVFGLFFDMADWLLQYARYLSDGDLLGFLWSPHYEDRVATTRLVLLADIRLFGGVFYPFVVISLACVCLVAAVLVNAIRSDGPFGIPSAIASFLVVMLLLNPAVGITCGLPAYDNYPHVLALAALALHFFDDNGRAGRAAFFRRLLALLAGIGAGLASASGLLIWPILVWAAWRGRLSGRWIAATAICGCGYVALYLQGNPLLGHVFEVARAGPLLSVGNLGTIAAYFFGYAGLPWSHDAGLRLEGAAIGVVLSAVIVALCIRRGVIDPPGGLRERVEVGLLAFVLGTAVLAAFGRAHFESPNATAHVPVKYTIFLSVAHAALVAAALPWLRRSWDEANRRAAVQVGALLLGGLLIVQQIGLGETAVQKAAQVNASIARFMAGQRDQEMWLVLHMDGGTADRALQFMRAIGIYDFRPK